MAKNIHSPRTDENEDRQTPSPASVIGSLLFTVVTILLILYVAILAISRTEGFRQMAKDRFRQRLCPSIEINSISINKKLMLDIKGLTAFCSTIDRTMCGVKAKEVRLAFVPVITPRIGLAIKSVDVVGACLDFVVDANGELQPTPLAPISLIFGDLAGWDPVDGAAAAATRRGKQEFSDALDGILDRRIKWTIHNSSITWRLHNGATLKKVADIELAVKPVDINSGPAYYIHFQAKRLASDQPESTVDRELIRLSDGQTREL